MKTVKMCGGGSPSQGADYVDGSPTGAYGSVTAGEAWFMVETPDASWPTWGDLARSGGNAEYVVVLEDSSGNRAWGYVLDDMSQED